MGTVLVSIFLDDAASSCRQLIRPSRKLLSQEAHSDLEEDGHGAPVFDFLPSARLRIRSKWSSLSAQLRRISLSPAWWLPLGHHPQRHLRPLRPRPWQGGCLELCAASCTSTVKAQAPLRSARGLPHGSRPNTHQGKQPTSAQRGERGHRI